MAALVRIFVHLLPPFAAPHWLGWPIAAPVPVRASLEKPEKLEKPEPPAAAPRHRGRQMPGGWYAWRLMTANNRELARSVHRFAGPDLCREAVRTVQNGSGRLLVSTIPDPMTGDFSWRGELDGVPVAAGKRYEHEQTARYAAKRFLDAVADAEVTDMVRALRDRRMPAPSRYATEGES